MQRRKVPLGLAILIVPLLVGITGCGTSEETTTTTFPLPATTTSINPSDNSKALRDLSSFNLDVSPRPDVRVQIRLAQLVISAGVSPIVVVDNQSSSRYIVTEKDFDLYVEGSTIALKATAIPHMPDSAPPGEVTQYNGFNILLPAPTSTVVGFAYTSNDPESKGRTWLTGSSGQ